MLQSIGHKVRHDGILTNHKNNEIMPFAAMWMDLEIIIVNEISKKKTNII